MLDWSAPLLIAGHSCLFSRYSAVKGFAPCKKEKRYHLAVAEGLRGADAVTAPTRAMLDALKAHYGQFCAAPAIYNGRNPAEFAPLMKKPLILSAGRLWDEAKNIKALSRVSGQVAWPIFVAGETRHPDGCFRNLTGVNCLGQLAPEILAQWMGRSAMDALPARYEPFGLSVLEAALAQCALVLGDIPSLRELWHGAALFVPPDDSRAVGKAITSLIEDRALRERLDASAQARRTAHAAAHGKKIFRPGFEPPALRREQSKAGGTENADLPYRYLVCPGAQRNTPRHGVGLRHEHRHVLSFARLRLEPRERPLFARHRD